MRERWLNNKQPDENGDIVLVIENNAGNRVSTFKGKSIEEVADQLAVAQVNANRQLARVLKPDTGRQPFHVEPRELTPADRLRLSNEITNPDRVAEAVTEIVTAVQGAAPSAVGKKFSELDRQASEEYYRMEAEAFMADYPDYYPVTENKDKLLAALNAKGYDMTRNNLAIAYQQIAGQLVEWPNEGGGDSEEEEPLPSPPVAVVAPPPQPRPRSVSTGLRNADASASKPAPRKPAPLITRAALERMSRAEYNERITDPAFRRAVDALA